MTIFDEHGDPITVTFDNYTFEENRSESGSSRSGGQSDPKKVRMPINCTLRKLLVKEGDVVKEGDQLLVMEVMKQHVSTLWGVFEYNISRK